MQYLPYVLTGIGGLIGALAVVKNRAPNSPYAKLLNLPGKWLYSHLYSFDQKLDKKLETAAASQAPVDVHFSKKASEFENKFWRDNFRLSKKAIREFGSLSSPTPP